MKQMIILHDRKDTIMTLKALFNNVSTFNKLSCMALHATSVCDKVWKWSPEKIASQKHY